MDETDLLELGISETPAERVGRLAALAQSSGLDGVVCSAQEAAMLSKQCGPEFSLITPGFACLKMLRVISAEWSPHGTRWQAARRIL